MKRCDHCQNEATHYVCITVNGRTEERYLCADCAARQSREGDPLFQSPEFFFLPMFSRARVQRKPSEEPDASETVHELQSEEKQSLATLKAQLKRALRREDYLTAARVRDSIRALEGK